MRGGTKQLSSKRARAALVMLLTGAKPERLASFTAQGLAASYRVPIGEVEKLLAVARQGRLI